MAKAVRKDMVKKPAKAGKGKLPPWLMKGKDKEGMKK